MNENMLITYIAPDLIMLVKEFIDKMAFGFQTKGYEDFKGTNLLVSIEFIGRLTNRSGTRYKVNVNNVVESMQSKGIKFMSPLKISSEERAGEEWNISSLIEPKILKQPKDYISYENNRGLTSIRFVDYKEQSLDDLEASSSEAKLEENRRHSICEFMEKLDIDNEINHYKQKLTKIHDEYKTSMICKWAAIRERELYFRREICRLENIKKDRELNAKKFSIPIKKNDLVSKQIDNRVREVQKELEHSKDKINDIEDNDISEDEQWEINNKLLLESYEEEDEDTIEICSNNSITIINPLENKELPKNNAIEAMEIDPSTSKRRRGPEIKKEGESERPTRKPGTWPPEKEESAYRYIPGQYKHKGSKRREFEKMV